MKTFQRVILFVALSLIIHQLLYISMEFRKATLQSQLLLERLQNITDLVEIELTEETEKVVKKVVTATDMGKKVDRPTDTIYQSKDNRVVKEEQVAKYTGPTQNSPSTARSKKTIEPEKKQALNKSEFGYFTKAPRNSTGYSTISEYVPNVKRGGFTSLNTNQFVYYAFFNRIKTQIHGRWVGNLNFLEHRLPISRQLELSKKDHITNVRVVVNADGSIKKIIIKKTSGFPETDLAVTEALRNAAPFVNPPKGLAKSDGLIHLDYSFHLTFNPPGLGSRSGS